MNLQLTTKQQQKLIDLYQRFYPTSNINTQFNPNTIKKKPMSKYIEDTFNAEYELDQTVNNEENFDTLLRFTIDSSKSNGQKIQAYSKEDMEKAYKIEIEGTQLNDRVIQKSQKSQTSSQVWNHFKKASSTSNLMKHLKKQHSIRAGISRQSTTIDEMFGPSKWKYNQEEMRNKLVKWIVIKQHPFTIVEEEDFINFVYLLYPNAEILSADTIKRDIMELAKMQTVLQKLQ
ncbi:3596_t:CDS:2, partial [Diversispora eburnea]